MRKNLGFEEPQTVDLALDLGSSPVLDDQKSYYLDMFEDFIRFRITSPLVENQGDVSLAKGRSGNLIHR